MTQRLTGSFVRLFARSEFIANSDWPDDIGLAFVVADGVPQQIHPFHENESSTAVLDRIEQQTGDLTDYGIHSVNAEDRYGRHAFSFDRDLLRLLEDRIAEDEQLLEDTLCMSQGLDLKRKEAAVDAWCEWNTLPADASSGYLSD